MIKLKASFSKKDVNGDLYSSAVEFELPDGLSGEQIIARDHEAFDLLKQAVDEEIGNGNHHAQPAQQQPQNSNYNQQNYNHQPHQTNDQPANGNLATQKQLKLLYDLGTRNGVRINEVARTRFNLPSASQMTKGQCAVLIDEFKAGTQAA